MKKIYLALALGLAFTNVYAQTTTLPPCPDGTVTCNVSTQHMGDTQQTASADNNHAQTTQAGNAANSIASGVNVNPSVQQSGNAVTQNGNSVQGGDASATGNELHSDNRSSASTGASNANNGGMTGFGGNSSSGGNTLKGGNTSQGQGQSSDNSLRGGNTKIGDVGSTSGALARGGNQSTRTSADNSGGNSTTAVDASDRSVNNSRSSFVVMPDQPSVPMSISPASNVAMMADSQCGPYQEVIRTPIYGWFDGAVKSKRRLLDYNDTLAPPSRYDEESTVGVRAIYTTTVLNASSARSISIGFVGSSGGGAGNVGGSGSMTVQVTHIQLRACRMVQRQETRIIYVPETVAPIAPAAKRIWHKRVTPKACPPVTGK